MGWGVYYGFGGEFTVAVAVIVASVIGVVCSFPKIDSESCNSVSS